MLHEKQITDRKGRLHTVLAWSSGTKDGPLSCDRLTDFQVSKWFVNLSHRCGPFDVMNLLREECERRGLSTDPDALPGQRSLF